MKGKVIAFAVMFWRLFPDIYSGVIFLIIISLLTGVQTLLSEIRIRWEAPLC